MIGSFLTRGLVMIFGYAYPAYECYKSVELNKPEIEQLRFWCQYWILVAVLTVCERIGDAFVSWVPMYSEAKLAFYIYLWYPKTKGTTYVYDSFFRPYVAKHENEIDRNLSELRTRAGDMAVIYWQRAASYGQTRIFEILQFVASQSTPRPRPPQPPQNTRPRRPPTAPSRQAAPATAPPETEEPPSPTSSTSSSQHQKEVAEEVGPSKVPETAQPTATTSNAKKATSAATSSLKKTSSPKKASSMLDFVRRSATAPAEAEEKQIVSVSSSASDNSMVTPKDTVMEETTRVTRGRLRKTRSTPNQ